MLNKNKFGVDKKVSDNSMHFFFSVSNQLFDCTLFKYFESMLAHINWHWQVIKCLVTQSNLLKVIKIKIKKIYILKKIGRGVSGPPFQTSWLGETPRAPL